MELKWLEDYLSLCETGNFRLSSKNRCISQPAFSRRIKALENWLGTLLIDRSGQQIELTNAGLLFKPLALELVQLTYKSRNELKTQIEADEGRITFSTVSTLAQFFMPGWLKNLQSFIDIPSYSVRTDFRNVDDYLSGLEQGEVDFFISYDDPSGIIVNYTKKFQSLMLGSESLIPVVSPDKEGKPRYWLPSAKPGSTIPYLHTNAKPAQWPIKHHLDTQYRDLIFLPVYETSIATAVKAMVMEGYGVAWIPKSIVADDLASGALLRAAEERHDILLDIKIYRHKATTDAEAEKFWRVLNQSTDNPTD